MPLAARISRAADAMGNGRAPLQITRYSNGRRMTPEEFDRAEFDEGWVYELIDGVLVVSPSPLENERDPNQYLGHLLLTYQETNLRGGALDSTLPEHTIRTRRSRRRADRVIWAGLGRLPRRHEIPTIVVEFVSRDRRDWARDYDEKRREYLTLGVKEYWIFDRFRHTLTVFSRSGRTLQKRVYRQRQTYSTDLLPGFLVPIARLFKLADQWGDSAHE